MNDDDLERTLHDSLEQRARHLGEPNVSLDAVWNRVDRRRNRRRGVAVVGSCAAVGIGVLGIAALADRTPGEGQSVGGGPATAPSNVLSSLPVGPTATFAGEFWRCEGEIGRDETFSYFASCQLLPAGTPVTYAPVEGTLPLPVLPPTTIEPVVYRQGDTPPQLREFEVYYEVGDGDSLESIADLFSVQVFALINYNAWLDGLEHPLFAGDVIMIPPNFTPGVTGVPVIDCNSGGITTTTQVDAVCADVDATESTAVAEIPTPTTTTMPATS